MNPYLLLAVKDQEFKCFDKLSLICDYTPMQCLTQSGAAVPMLACSVYATYTYMIIRDMHVMY